MKICREFYFQLVMLPHDEVRLEAARRGLSVSNKPDSYDICFISDGDTALFFAFKVG